MIFWILLFATFAVAAAYVAAAGFVLWKVVLVLVLSYIVINVGYVAAVCYGGYGMDRSKPVDKQYKSCRWGAAKVTEFLDVYLRLRVHITGEEKLPKDQNFLYVCNHRSSADPIVVVDKLRDYNISFVCKPSLQKIPVIWPVGHGAGYLPIDRDNDREALKTIITAANYIKKGVCSIGIYPEGTRSKTDEMLPFHAGSFKIAQRAGAPIAIACIRGTEKISKNYPLRHTDIYLDILEVIPAEQVKATATAELAEYSRTLIAERLAEVEGK